MYGTGSATVNAVVLWISAYLIHQGVVDLKNYHLTSAEDLAEFAPSSLCLRPVACSPTSFPKPRYDGSPDRV